MERKIRFLLSMDGHSRGYGVVATTLREAGLEVILGGQQLPREMVETAIEEDVDMIGYHLMQGAPSILIPRLFEKMKEKGIENIPVVVGGIIPEKDEVRIKGLGVKAVFHPLTPLQTIAETVKAIAEDSISSREG